MNIIKTKIRNRLLAGNTDELMRININGPELTINSEKGVSFTRAVAVLNRAKEVWRSHRIGECQRAGNSFLRCKEIEELLQKNSWGAGTPTKI